MTEVPDIYFFPQWAQAYQDIDKGKAELFEFKHEYGHVYYQFIKKIIPQSIKNETYYDTITPYGFGGPIVLACQPEKKRDLLKLYNDAFQTYCLENHIVAEYIRFSPWLLNHLDFQNVYELKYNNVTFYTDLTSGDFFMNEYDSNRRNKIRKALKSGAQIECDYTGESLNEFIRIYKYTAERNGIADYYLFEESFLKDSFQKLGKNQFMVNVIYEGEYISSSINIHHGNFVHGHLAANDPQYLSLGGSSLLYYAVAQWGVEHGKTQFHFGGAHAEGLYHFKKSFTRNGISDFYVGKKVRNQEVYDLLSESKAKEGIHDPTFFPKYRG